MKRKSEITDFFASKSPKPDNSQAFTWSIHHESLIKGTYNPKDSTEKVIDGERKPEIDGNADIKVRVAAFDLDSTLVATKGKSPWPRSADDWKWAFEKVPTVIRQLYHNDKSQIKTDIDKESPKESSKDLPNGTDKDSSSVLDNAPYTIVIFSNQGSTVPREDTKRFQQLKERVRQIVTSIGVPVLFYAAAKVDKTKESQFRKPKTGMWDELIKDLAQLHQTIDMEKSFYCGDALGRPNDFADSDKQFANAIGITCYTPEYIFYQI